MFRQLLFILSVNALRENQCMKELFLNENKLQANDGMYIGGFLKENKHLELLDLRSNQLQVSLDKTFMTPACLKIY
jgi:hypothetical protein